MSRLVKAFMIAPAAPFLVYLPFPIIAMFGLPIAYATTFLAVMLIDFLAKKDTTLQSAKFYVLTGLLLSFGVSLIFSLWLGYFSAPSNWVSVYILCIWFSFHGAVSAYIYWRIAKPDLLKNKTSGQSTSKSNYIIFIPALLAAIALAANPVFAKNYKKATIGCVPSPNPDVPPCDLDQTPLMPSEIAKKQAGEKKSDNDATNRTKQKAPRQRNKETGY